MVKKEKKSDWLYGLRKQASCFFVCHMCKFGGGVGIKHVVEIWAVTTKGHPSDKQVHSA